MSAPVWQPSHTYIHGAIVRPTNSSDAPPDYAQPLNPGFESGSSDWTLGASTAVTTSKPYSGAHSLEFTGTTSLSSSVESYSTDQRLVQPGQGVSASCFGNTGGNSGGASVTMVLYWYNSSHANIGQSAGTPVVVSRGSWQQSSVSAAAPAGAAYVGIAVAFIRTSGSADSCWADACAWTYHSPVGGNGLLYEAVQTPPGKSAGIEPVWPLSLGVTVVDGGVTWDCIQGTEIEWTASPLDIAGGTEPVWPTVPGGVVNDNGVTWLTSTPMITDVNCPNSRIARIGASKVFVGDNDIVRFCATDNALDWTTQYDAGYLPTGLQSDTETKCTALGMYRGNLAVFMSSTLQLWQIDPDPAAMSFLDQIPGIGTDYSRGLASVTNDLYFLASLGVRSVSISAGTANLEAGDIGTPIDSLVQEDLAAYRALIAANATPGWEPLGLYVPSAGQYVLFLGNHAWVFGYSPSAQLAAWSKYTVPWQVTDACTLDGDLYVRGDDNNVYRLDKEAAITSTAFRDDSSTTSPTGLVACGEDALGPYSSTDGVTWTAAASGATAANSVAQGNGIWLCIQHGAAAHISHDGTSWAPITSPDPKINSICFGDNVFALGTLPDGVGNGTLNTTTDGVLWARPLTEHIEGGYQSIRYVDNRFVAVTNKGYVGISVDGHFWYTKLVGANLFDAAYGNGVYMVVGHNGETYTSPDAVTWTHQSTQLTSDSFSYVGFYNGLFLGSTVGGLLYTSADGAVWTQNTTIPGAGGPVTVFGDGVLVAGPLYLYKSTNLVTWTQRTLGAGSVVQSVAITTDTVSATAPYLVTVRWPYQSYQATDQYLQVYGVDVLFNEQIIGTAGVTDVQIGYDENNVDNLTDAISVGAVASRGEDGFVPIETMSPSASVQVTYLGAGAWTLTQVNLYTDVAPRAP